MTRNVEFLRVPELPSRALGWVMVLAATVLVAGCRQDMHDAPRYDPLEASVTFADGASARMLVEGTVPRGMLIDDELLHQGSTSGQPARMFPFAIARAGLDRGEERFKS